MLKHTPLITQHQNMGAKLVDFGGWSMPLHYGSQMEEHHYVRRAAGMFDVSHMTVVDIEGEDAKSWLQYLLANDVDKLKAEGKALYSAMLNEQGGVIDDLIVYRRPLGYRLVVNCATREKDLAWMQKQVGNFNVVIKARDDLAMIAVQGPQACAKVENTLACTLEMPYFSALESGDLFIARTGYTGEDGVEIILPATRAAEVWETLAAAGVHACGLGARDTLRLEAGMNLYGHEMDEKVSPWVANMGWTLAMESARDFIGKPVLEAQKNAGIKEKLVGLVLEDKGVLRAEQIVYIGEGETREGRGIVTSGSFSPTLGKSIALARVPIEIGGFCRVEIRNKLLSARVQAPCFVRRGTVV